MKRLLLFLAALALFSLSCKTVESLIWDESIPPTPRVELLPSPDDPPPAPVAPTVPPLQECPGGDCVVACMKDLGNILTASSANAMRGRAASAEAEEIILVTYTVAGDKLVNPIIEAGVPGRLKKLQENTQAHYNIWNYYAALIPSSQRAMMNEFVIYTDGEDEGLAAVSQSLTDPARWDMMVDIADASDPQWLTFTLVHEFGHLLTLNAGQIEPDLAMYNNPDDPDVFYEQSLLCDNYFTYEGCTNADAYLNLFVDAFWSDVFDEWAEIDVIEDEDEYYAALDAFYSRYDDQFITDYAATSPEEDIAETFSFFILEARPTGNSIAEQKVLFFYQFPELVELRRQIAVGLCSQAD